MGLKVSTTCEVTFGDKEPAVGTLLGDVHDGIAQMFHVIENARMLVGTKAIATLSTGYLNALEYAKERVQGADLTQMTDKTAPRVTITHHPDVRRSLMTQKAYAEGLRALVLFTASQQDTVDQAFLAGGSEELEKGSPADIANRVNDLLLPIVKGLGSERAWVLLGTESLQTLGGSGFLQDYPIEQYIRDAKIDTLYEGTTAIQGLDFFFRKIVRDKGQALSHLADADPGVRQGPRRHGRPPRHRARAARQGPRGRPGHPRLHGRRADEVRPAQEGGDVDQPLQGRPEHHPPAAGRRRPRRRLAAAAPGRGRAEGPRRAAPRARTATSTRARSPRRRSSPGTSCPKIAAERAIAEATDNALMDVPESAF